MPAHAENCQKFAKALLFWHNCHMYNSMSPIGHLAHLRHRTVKADVLVNCARIGFKP